MKIDNFALTMHQACPAKYDLRIRQGWRSRRRSGALGFGGAFHAGLAQWYWHFDAPFEQRLLHAFNGINEAWDTNVPADDYRTLERCLSTMKAYAKEYPRENFRPVIGPEGPLIEVPFTIDTGMFLDCLGCGTPWTGEGFRCIQCGNDLEPIEYGGIFDGLVEFGDNVYILEHKTTSQMGPSYFTQFKPNNQVTGYCWAGGTLSGNRVGGAYINAIAILKSGTKFDRQLSTRNMVDIERWLRDLRSECNAIKRHEREGHFPMRTPSCTQYGRCEFHDVHVIGDSEYQKNRLEQDFVIEPWDFEARDEKPGGTDGNESKS